MGTRDESRSMKIGFQGFWDRGRRIESWIDCGGVSSLGVLRGGFFFERRRAIEEVLIL